jgi:hypothetical protein
MTPDQLDEVQLVSLLCIDATCAGTFRLSWLSALGEQWRTSALSYNLASSTSSYNTAMAAAVRAALVGMPNDAVPAADVVVTTAQSGRELRIEVTFTGVPGNVKELTVTSNTFASSNATLSTWTVTETTAGTKESIECSGRGLCDTSSGLCKCFRGYTGGACSRQSAIAM